jgi:ribosomal protein S18 acetylase RimI-like enzyme
MHYRNLGRSGVKMSPLPLLGSDEQAITIRAATPSDAPAIGRVHVQSWRETYRGMLSDALLDSVSATVRAAMWSGALEAEAPVLLYVAERGNGDLVGFAAGGGRRSSALTHDAEIYAIYLLNAVRRRGCGRRLMAALAAALRALQFRSLCLWVLRDNTEARGFYERLGGQLVGERTKTEGEHTFEEVAYGWPDLNALCGPTVCAVEIEPFQPTDAPLIAGFVAAIQEHERAYVPELRPGGEIAASYANMIVANAAGKDGVILLAKAAGEAVGFVCAWIDSDDDPLVREEARVHAYLSDIYVVPEWRCRGVARLLLEAVEAHMRRRGCRRLRVGAKAGNAAALACYEAIGYRPYEIIFGKTLDP